MIRMLALLLAFATSTVAAPPNIVLIVADDLGWRDCGFMGSDFYETPNLDRLAGQGMVFTDAYSNGPNCAPSRAALMSGQYAPRTGVYTVNSPNRGKSRDRRLVPTPNRIDLDHDVVTLAEVLKQHGYATASVGKWHLGDGDEGGPLAQGFDVNVAGDQRGAPRRYHSPYKNQHLGDGEDGEHLTARLTTEAIEILAAHRDRPQFLYLPFFAVHTPIQPPKDLARKYRDKTPGERHTKHEYAALVEGMDRGIGRIMRALDDLDLAEDTIVVFTSDNGGHGGQTTMAPLRGSKGMLYEGGIRVPMIVRWPGRVAAGSTCSTPVIGLDLYPTLVEAAGAKPPAIQTVDGESLVSLLTGGAAPQRDALYWHFPAYLAAYRGLDVGIWRTTPCSVVRKGRYKLHEYFEDGRLELYDLVDDVGEAKNLAEELPRKTRELHADLLAWRESVEAPVPEQRNPDFVRTPNIVFFMADDLGYAELGCYGQTKIRTPNLDRLAAEGMRFTQHYSGHPVCAPSRCVVMTGLHTGHAYIRNNKGRPVVGQYPIPPNTQTVARLLKSRGYATACVGKWGLGGPDTTGVPWTQGFDLFFGYLDQWRAHSHYPTYLYRNGTRVPLDNHEFDAHQKLAEPPDDPAVFDQYQGNDYAPDRMIDEAVAFIRRKRDEPFFLYYATPVPHVGLQVPEDSLNEYPLDWDDEPYLGQRSYVPHPRPRAAYAAMVTRMDDHFGRIVDLIRELDLAEDTIILFSSDNGPTFNGGSDSAFFESAGGFRGLKASLFEGGIRVPMIAWGPGRIAPGTETDHVSYFPDLLPTFMELAGGAAPKGLDGISMVPTLTGRPDEQPAHETLYWEIGRGQALRAGDWKLVRQTNQEGQTRAMLFNLRDDVGETTNLAESHPEQLERMLGLIRAARTPSEVFASPYDDGR